MTAKAVDVGLSYRPFTRPITKGGYWVHLSATGQVLAQPGKLIGFYVNSTNAGTIQLFDSLTNTNPVSGVITPAKGMNPFQAVFLTGIFAAIGGTALDVTFLLVK